MHIVSNKNECCLWHVRTINQPVIDSSIATQCLRINLSTIFMGNVYLNLLLTELVYDSCLLIGLNLGFIMSGW